MPASTGLVEEPMPGSRLSREKQKATFLKCLKLRRFRGGVVNQCVLVRISPGELGVGSKVVEAGVYGKNPRVQLVSFTLFPKSCAFSLLRKLSWYLESAVKTPNSWLLAQILPETLGDSLIELTGPPRGGQFLAKLC